MHAKKRLAVVALSFLGLFLLVRTVTIQILRSSVDMDFSCYARPATQQSFPSFNASAERARLGSGRNIFFHETSCFGESDLAELNCRQACAVESAARMNPGMTVNLFFLSPSGPSNRTIKLVEQLLAYDNVRVNRVHVDDYIRNTPIERWFTGGVLETSRWPRSHMSDIMRYLTLWKFGGIYLDLDVVVTTSLEDLTDFAGAEDSTDVAAGVMGFSTTGLGRRIANACLRDLMVNFDGDVWGNNGPGVITRTLQKYCAVTDAKDMTPERCMGFKVFPPSVFYPIYYEEWQNYFTMAEANETMELIKRARAIHVWNKLSKAEAVQVGSRVPYALVAEKFCSRVYNSCGPTF